VSEYIVSGAERIAEAVGEHKDNIGNLVVQEELPAWKRTKKGSWKAHPDDLKEWARKQADKYRQKSA